VPEAGILKIKDVP